MFCGRWGYRLHDRYDGIYNGKKNHFSVVVKLTVRLKTAKEEDLWSLGRKPA